MTEHMAEVIATVVVAVLGSVTTVVVNIRGFASLRHHVDVALQNKIDVPEHRASLTQIHNEKNELAKKVAVLEDQNKRLEADVAVLKGKA